MNTEPLICPVCDEGLLTPEIHSDEFLHYGGSIQVDGLSKCVCSECGADPVLNHQIRSNKLLISDVKRVHDGLLIGGAIRDIRKGLGLSQAEAGQLFGGGANAFSKYERGDVIQSKPMDQLLRAAMLRPDLIEFFREKEGLLSRQSSLKFVAKNPIATSKKYTPVRVGSKRESVPVFSTDWHEANGVAA